jgi:hypothetical protein
MGEGRGARFSCLSGAPRQALSPVPAFKKGSPRLWRNRCPASQFERQGPVPPFRGPFPNPRVGPPRPHPPKSEYADDPFSSDPDPRASSVNVLKTGR